jgi:hypothetical protein
LPKQLSKKRRHSTRLNLQHIRRELRTITRVLQSSQKIVAQLLDLDCS